MSGRKYVIYENDLKFKSKRNIDPNKAEWDSEHIENTFFEQNLDTLAYRFDECEKNNFEYLDLSHLELEKIPDVSIHKYAKDFAKVKYLFLNDNKLTECPTNLQYFPNLEVFDISSNLITTISYLPKSLKEFVCHNNRLKSLPSHDYLHKLDCSHNSITSLNKYCNIIDIICHDNRIKMIPTYQNINRIICKNNPLIHINTQPSVESLDCSNTNISGKISNMPNLKYLICNDTKIDDVSNLVNLESLEILNSSISKLPYLSKLKGLLYKNTQNISISSKYKIDMYYKERDNSFIKFV